VAQDASIVDALLDQSGKLWLEAPANRQAWIESQGCGRLRDQRCGPVWLDGMKITEECGRGKGEGGIEYNGGCPALFVVGQPGDFCSSFLDILTLGSLGHCNDRLSGLYTQSPSTAIRFFIASSA
jgi:hypothetical protein